MNYNHHHKGYAILIVLIVVAIILILCATQMKTLFVPNLPLTHTNLQQRPWQLEELLVPAGETVKLPRSPKPELTEPFTVKAPVRRDGIDRGEVTIGFKTDGRIKSKWNVRYTQNEKDYAISAEMDGNIDIKRTWEDDGTKDKSRLFFIASGPYQKRTAGGAEPDEEGTAWIIGWLKPDYAIEGHITLTTDRKWSAVYEFTAPGLQE